MCAICKDMGDKVTKILRIRTGCERTIDGFVWFRIDPDEFKVHPASGEPDGPGSRWVDRTHEDIADAVRVVYAN